MRQLVAALCDPSKVLSECECAQSAVRERERERERERCSQTIAAAQPIEIVKNLGSHIKRYLPWFFKKK
jgi:hypothetical protein